MAINPKVRIVGIPLWPYSDIQNLRGAEGRAPAMKNPSNKNAQAMSRTASALLGSVQV